MKTKSRAVRRNSSGFGSHDDVCVSAGGAVNDGRSPTPVLEGLGPAVSLSLEEGTASCDVVIRRDGFGHSVGMGVSLGCDAGACEVVRPPGRMSGGITINEPHSYPHSAYVRSERVSGSVDYVGKGKRKVDDILPTPSHGFVHVDACVSTHSLAAQNTSHVVSTSSAPSGVGTSTAPCIISQPNYGQLLLPAAPDTDNGTPAVLPVATQNTCVHQQPHRPSHARAPASYTRRYETATICVV